MAALTALRSSSALDANQRLVSPVCCCDAVATLGGQVLPRSPAQHVPHESPANRNKASRDCACQNLSTVNQIRVHTSVYPILPVLREERGKRQRVDR